MQSQHWIQTSLLRTFPVGSRKSPKTGMQKSFWATCSSALLISFLCFKLEALTCAVSHSPTVHLSTKTSSIFPITSSRKLKLPLYPPKPIADDIQHSIFRSSYLVTEVKPIDQAWYILGRSGSSQLLPVPSYATNGFLHNPSTGGRHKADQSVVLLLVLLALYEDEHKICLSPVFGISPVSWPLNDRKQLCEDSVSHWHPWMQGPMDLPGKQSCFNPLPQLVVPPLLKVCLVAKGLGRPYRSSLWQRRHHLFDPYLCLLSLTHLFHAAVVTYFPCESFSL